MLFLVASAAIGHVLSGPFVRLLARLGHPELLLVVGVSLCFTLAFVAEAIGLAAIVGAFAAGFVIDPYGEGVRTGEETATLSELLHPIAVVFVPLFFVLMGVQVELGSLATPSSLWLGAALVVAAIAGKLACALGVIDRRVDRPDGRRRDDSARGGGPDLRGDRRDPDARRPARPVRGRLRCGGGDGPRHDARRAAGPPVVLASDARPRAGQGGGCVSERTSCSVDHRCHRDSHPQCRARGGELVLLVTINRTHPALEGGTPVACTSSRSCCVSVRPRVHR